MSLSKAGKLFKKQGQRRRRSRSVETPENSHGFWDDSNEEENSNHVSRYSMDKRSSNGSESSGGNSSRSDVERNESQRDDDRSGPELCEGVTASSHSRTLECAICLQPCVHPARLPCSHVFCFLCLKGIARGPHTCAMCRAPIPLDYTDNPELVPVQLEDSEREQHTWFYEGRNFSGWWQYDGRTSTELEQFYQRGETKTEVLIAGYLYVVDFEEMMQFRKNEPARRRAIKRDVTTCPKKGIAGLRHPTLSGLSEALSRLELN